MKLILPTLFIVISILLYFVVVGPLWNDVDTLRAEVDQYNTALDNSTGLQKTRDTLLTKYNSISQDDKDKLQHLLPDSVNNIKFILEIERLANLHGMPIKNIKFENQNNDNVPDPKTAVVTAATKGGLKPYGVFPVEFSVDGNYDSFVLFLKDVEYNLRLVDVKSVSFIVPSVVQTKTADSPDPSIYTYDVKIDTYWLK